MHQLSRLEAFTSAAVQAALIARQLGRDVDVPDAIEIRRKFDEVLAREPESARTMTKQQIMQTAVGLRRR
jgi:hypothetical protein